MSLRARFPQFVGVVLRVPPLFLIDEVLKAGFADFPSSEALPEDAAAPEADSVFYRHLVLTAVRALLSCLGFASGLCLFLISVDQLWMVYTYLMSVGIIFVSYWTNLSTMKVVEGFALQGQPASCSILERLPLALDTSSCAGLVLQNYVAQCALALLFRRTHLGPKYPLLEKLLPLSFMAPSLVCVLPVPAGVLGHAPVFAALLPLALVKFHLMSSSVGILQVLYEGYVEARDHVNNYGFTALIESEWQRLSVPVVLRAFWLLRLLEHGALLAVQREWLVPPEPSEPPLQLAYAAFRHLMVRGCETLTETLGMTSVVSLACRYIGAVFQWLLQTEDREDKSVGTVSAVLFYILAMQTGLTGLEPEKRFVRLCRNLCLVFTALLHFIHNIVNPQLMSLSASHSPAVHRHVRALAVCAFLVAFPAGLLAFLWARNELGTWLLAVSVFGIEVISKVLVSLMIYALFLLDARRGTFWEGLDDYVYYIKAFGNSVEFCFGIFLFFNGAWILAFESGSAIRAVMMCIHAYFNIWCEAKSGWSIFIKRRTAVSKIESLPEAAPDQLSRLDDVCAICYQEMRSAKVTRCNHFFHGVCLRKWLYVQDRCPLCHEILHGCDKPADLPPPSDHR